MADRVGRGATLGAALRAVYAPLKRTPAVGWHARVNQLTATARGQEILAQHAAPGRGGRKWLGWLSHEVTPNKRSQAAIERAYFQYLGRTPAGAVDHGRQVRIYGVVDMGAGDVRDRGAHGSAPLLVHHAGADRRGGWRRFDAAVTADTPVSDDDLADLYADDVMDADDNLGWSGDAPSFPGGAYVVVVSG